MREASHKVDLLYDSVYIKSLELTNVQKQEVDWWWPRAGDRGELGEKWRITTDGCGGSFGGGEINVLKLILVMTAQLCEYTRNHWIINLKWVNCMVCELCLKVV